MSHFRTSRTKEAFLFKDAIILTSFTVICTILRILPLWLLQRLSNWYYPFLLIGILLFICRVTFIERHFDIVYIP